MNNERKVNNLSGFNSDQINSYLFSAINYKDIPEVRKALEAGADVTSVENGDTPLHAAVRVKSPRIITLLLEYGADMNAENEAYESALQLAYQVCDNCARVMDEYFLTNENIQRREEQKRASNERRRAEQNAAMRKELAENKNLSYLKDKIEDFSYVKNERYYELVSQYDKLQRAIRAKYSGGKRKYRKTRKSHKASKKTRKGKRRA